MNLLDELIDTYFMNDMEDAYYDLIEKLIIYDFDEDEMELDWDDEECFERYHIIPTITSPEAFQLMERFTDSVEDEQNRNNLFYALKGHKPFRRFKDTLDEIGLRDEWFAFEYQYGKEQIEEWLEGLSNEWENKSE
jgi:hypothetical protein